MTTVEPIDEIRSTFERDLGEASTPKDVEAVRHAYAGRKGKVTQLLRSISDFPPEKRPELGRRLNVLKAEIEDSLREKLIAVQKALRDGEAAVDYTLPGRPQFLGRKHPLTLVWEEMRQIFATMGFTVARGPEVETEYYNFEALNIPKDHPARDMQDTFYLSDDVVLRTHTSPMQIRVMEAQPPPVRVVVPGRAYRNEAISARSYCVFHQVEGLYVDEGVTLGELKGTLAAFARQFFGPKVKVRFRASFFPFTEPSAEMDITCLLCDGSGCRVCKQIGWVELLGAGMVDPAVFEYVGYDPEKYTGFAWGMGIERIAMMRYGIDDIRVFFENDMRFLEQF